MNKKGLAFEKMSEECLVKIQRIRQKNDLMQKQIGTDEEESISEEIHNQQEYLEVTTPPLRRKSADSRQSFSKWRTSSRTQSRVIASNRSRPMRRSKSNATRSS